MLEEIDFWRILYLFYFYFSYFFLFIYSFLKIVLEYKEVMRFGENCVIFRRK